MFNWIRVNIEMIERMFYWGWHMRNSYDFDMHTLYDILERKLERTYDCMLNHGNCVWNSDPKNKEMRKLQACKEIANRLNSDNYCEYEHKKHDGKWGKIKIEFSEEKMIGGVKFSEILRNRKNIHTEEDEERESKEFHAIMKKEEELKNADKELFFKTLQKNIDGWWD